MKRILPTIAVWVTTFWMAASIYLISDNRGVSDVVGPMTYNTSADPKTVVVLKEPADVAEETREWLSLLAAWLALGITLFFQWRQNASIEERIARIEERLD